MGGLTYLGVKSCSMELFALKLTPPPPPKVRNGHRDLGGASCFGVQEELFTRPAGMILIEGMATSAIGGRRPACSPARACVCGLAN